MLEKFNCRTAGEGDVIDGIRIFVGVFCIGEINLEGSKKRFLLRIKEKYNKE